MSCQREPPCVRPQLERLDALVAKFRHLRRSQLPQVPALRRQDPTDEATQLVLVASGMAAHTKVLWKDHHLGARIVVVVNHDP